MARMLGGSGKDARNLTTLYQNPVNTPLMSNIERSVRDAVKNGEIVHYKVVPVYEGKELIPKAITVTAKGNKGFNLGVSILNINK